VISFSFREASARVRGSGGEGEGEWGRGGGRGDILCTALPDPSPPPHESKKHVLEALSRKSFKKRSQKYPSRPLKVEVSYNSVGKNQTPADPDKGGLRDPQMASIWGPTAATIPTLGGLGGTLGANFRP